MRGHIYIAGHPPGQRRYYCFYSHSISFIPFYCFQHMAQCIVILPGQYLISGGLGVGAAGPSASPASSPAASGHPSAHRPPATPGAVTGHGPPSPAAGRGRPGGTGGPGPGGRGQAPGRAGGMGGHGASQRLPAAASPGRLRVHAQHHSVSQSHCRAITRRRHFGNGFY